jgi:PEP-CTERM putative exosortase interaction domain
MKKTFAIFIAFAIASTTFAASIDWEMTGLNNALATHTGGIAADTTVYFLYGTEAAIDLLLASTTASKSEFESALASITLDTTASNSEGKKPTESFVENIFSSGITAGANNYFGMLYYSEDAKGNGYYKLVTGSGVGYIYNPESLADAQRVQLSWQTMRNDTWTQAYAVPEPATAALALAGLALLIRRRK